MSKTLGGFLFFKDAEKYDYCYKEAILSLELVCDVVVVVHFHSGKEWSKEEEWIKIEGYYKNKRIKEYRLPDSIWHSMKGKTKIANIQNIASMLLDTEYQLLVQADEVIHPDSYGAIRDAMETGGEGFLCERVNLWGDPNHMLVVPQERQPCSTSVIRLTKRGYWCYDDGENIGAPASPTFRDKIKIIHYGFVRKREVMKAKIINMQEGVFGMANHDPKLDQCEVFDPYLWFKNSDLAPINFTHPPIMNQWVIDRM